MHMNFTHPLPGVRAQLEMAPEYRRASLQCVPPAGAREAAVLALLTPANAGRSKEELMGWSVLLTRRNLYAGVHSGQISLPGGKRSEADNDLWATACREAGEEVGIPPERLERVGALSSIYVPPSNFVIQPFVAVNRGFSAFVPEPREVVAVKNVPLGTFNPQTSAMTPLRHEDGVERLVPAWRYEDFIVWGATAMILSELYRLVDGGAIAASRNDYRRRP